MCIRDRPYRVLATSRSDGFLEMVQKAQDLQQLKNKYKSGLQKYFEELADKQMLSRSAESGTAVSGGSGSNYNSGSASVVVSSGGHANKDGAFTKIMESYLNSCAGYCVITYILGIGDRHLENLMINDEGKFFHIDFGFILGNDPKMSPPPFKLCKEMVDAMGGSEHRNFQKFKTRCVETYHYLRKHAKLLINLLHLMIDSGIEQITPKALEKLAEKFKLNESDEEAEKYFNSLIEESFTALMPVVMDKIHEWAVYWKKQRGHLVHIYPC
eukprot:TRINITY_DN5863_c0_g1_i1.p1 TRINITY_DN5863_c0_g1~~TRINITY_DN5863_c0_g1_i1.p1  ORF type:complete len:294 (-),score=89.51 TRINITY_DN5863_c0_g1_i1:297-1106(-)